MFLVNSCSPQFCVPKHSLGVVIPKLPTYFAEFLKRYSLIRLSVLHLLTCVGLATEKKRMYFQLLIETIKLQNFY